jgi:hypothetical protein
LKIFYALFKEGIELEEDIDVFMIQIKINISDNKEIDVNIDLHSMAGLEFRVMEPVLRDGGTIR